MGSWGTGVFENDDASDLVAEITDGGGMERIEEAINQVLASEGGYLEAPEAAAGLAAAEVIARLRGKPGSAEEFPEELEVWTATAPKVSDALVAKARRALLRILGEASESKETWIEAEDYRVWERQVRQLAARL